MNWHYVEEGKEVGPISDDQLLDLERAGKINAETLVWHDGMAGWKAFSQVKLDLRPSVAAPIPAEPIKAETVSSPVSESGNRPEAVCGECGNIFPLDEMIRHGNLRICPNCKPVLMRKLSEGAKIDMGEIRYAGFGVRLGAKFLDALIFGIPVGLSLVAIVVLLTRGLPEGQTPGQFGFWPLGIVLGLFAVQMAYVVFFLGKYGATPGKMICKLRVVTAAGGTIGYGRATGRYFAEMFSGVILCLGYLPVLFDGEKRALHDRLCKVRVIHS